MAADPLVGKLLADRFEVLERIGEGSIGVVYRARQVAVDRIVALKVLGSHVAGDPQWVARFQNEARAASRLDHEHTVRVIDSGQTADGLLYIAMEHLSGTSLRGELERLGRLPAARALRIVQQICGSLGDAHRQGIIHRDIKPDNVFLVERHGAARDFVKVLDFSVAKLEDAQKTVAGMVLGTPAYMSPEQGRGAALDARSDLYSLGIVAYEMVAGSPPFDGKIPTEVVMKHLGEPPPPIAGCPPPLWSLLARALEKDPARRQQTAEQLDAECEACLAELLAPAAQAAPPAAASALANQKTLPPTVAPPIVSAAPDQKTGVAEAPQLARGLAPPAAPALAAPPAGAPRALARPDAHTMAASAPGAPGAASPAAAPGARAPLAAASPSPAAARASGTPPSGTQLLPDSKGVVAFARDAAHQARQSGAHEIIPAPPAGGLFWLAWILVGLGGGLAFHFYRLAQAGVL